jgi:hypothetical protein
MMQDASTFSSVAYPARSQFSLLRVSRRIVQLDAIRATEHERMRRVARRLLASKFGSRVDSSSHVVMRNAVTL